jgi:hypothetical protein
MGAIQDVLMEKAKASSWKLLTIYRGNASLFKELARHHKQKGEWKNFNGANPYLEHYGDDWEIHMKNAPKMRAFK